MKFAIPDIASADLDLANSAMVGAETLVSISYSDVMIVGELSQNAAQDASQWSGEGAYLPPAGTAGRDMVLVCANGVLSDELLEVVFDVKLEGAGTPDGTATASFVMPAGVRDDTFNLPIGLSVDMTVDGVGNEAKKIHSVTGINAITGGRPGNRFMLVVLPDDFVEVACAMDKNPTIPSQKAIAIPCGYDAARWVKKGRSDVPSLEVSAKYTSGGDGLMRLNGFRVVAMLEAVKDDRLLTERSIFWGWRPTVVPKHGDGDSEDEVRATGLYEKFAIFV